MGFYSQFKIEEIVNQWFTFNPLSTKTFVFRWLLGVTRQSTSGRPREGIVPGLSFATCRDITDHALILSAEVPCEGGSGWRLDPLAFRCNSCETVIVGYVLIAEFYFAMIYL